MKNPATTMEHDKLNKFTRKLKKRCRQFGTQPVVLRDGRILIITYFKEDDYEMFRYVNPATNTYLIWEMCGRSITSRDFDIVSM